jgi:phosphatidylethanolamine/phosphatidyl-N-methylethanolamine N-methyltransferase
MDLQSVLNAYRRHAPYYDAVFGLLLGPGRQRTVDWANRLPGKRLLEVGVGTGLSLPHYRPDLRITGIDISPEMLRLARRRARQRHLTNVDALLEMDAECLDFPDDSFDLAIAMYVASVVPNPRRMIAEVQRVCRTDGHILIVNHFAEENGLRGKVERKLAPLSRKLGWRPDFPIQSVLSSGTLEILAADRAAPFGLFTILHCRNAKTDSLNRQVAAIEAPAFGRRLPKHGKQALI